MWFFILQVKPVHYMMLTLKSNVRLRPGEELNKLPKGMEFKYAVEYFDNFGSKFDAANVTIKTTFNRADSIALSPVEDNSFSVKFLHDGDLILKVFNEKYPNGMADFAHMMIGDILFPTKVFIFELILYVFIHFVFSFFIFEGISVSDLDNCRRHCLFFNAIVICGW